MVRWWNYDDVGDGPGEAALSNRPSSRPLLLKTFFSHVTHTSQLWQLDFNSATTRWSSRYFHLVTLSTMWWSFHQKMSNNYHSLALTLKWTQWGMHIFILQSRLIGPGFIMRWLSVPLHWSRSYQRCYWVLLTIKFWRHICRWSVQYPTHEKFVGATMCPLHWEQ